VGAAALAVYAEREARDARAELAAMRVDAGKRNRHDALAISVLDRRLEAVSHPLHAALSWPVNGEVTSPFGARGCCEFHPGIDIDAPAGAAVHPAAAGVVVAAGEESGYGNRVVVDHGRDLETLYGHLGSIDVETGQAVTAASTLGTVGCTGLCDGVHLHFEVHLNGEKSDPSLWLPEQDRAVAALHWGG
jgi:murein DD-endopeptidase MepM/ murein hydrolase activator NlpD